MNKYWLLFFVLLRIAFNTAGQTAPNNELKIIPPSPTVAELGRFGLASARLSDGAFSTQVPVYQYKTKNLTLPISLVYSTNGLIVDKIASRVGMDWSLIAGGSIGRMVLGGADEMKPWVTYPSDFPNTTGQMAYNFVFEMAHGDFETMPDIYSFNFNGYSGRFLYFNNSIVKLEQNNFDIEKTDAGFRITDNNGIKYDFTLTETSQSSSNCSGNPYAQSGFLPTSWMLTQITHPLGDIIYLTYKTSHFIYSPGTSQTYTSGLTLVEGTCPNSCPVLKGVALCTSNITNNGLLLDKIYSNYNGLVQFSYMERADVPGDSAIAGINVYDATCDRFGNIIPSNLNGLNTVHSYEFDYSFPGSIASFPGSGGNATAQRMYLANFVADDKSYFFQYNNLDQLPGRLSYAQDQYGYFNGKNNASLIPAPANLTDYNYFLSWGYGDRKPDYTYALKGTMNKIIYPTGGSDSIVYESHSVYHNGSYDCNSLDITNSPRADGPSAFKQVTYYYSDVFTVHCTQTVNFEVANIPLNGTVDYPIGYYGTWAGLIDASGGDPITPNTPWEYSTDVNTNELFAHVQEDNMFRFNLNPGTYRLVVKVQGPARGFADFTYNDASGASGNVSIGGVRVKEVITNTFNNAPLERKYYYSNAGTNASSGVVADEFANYLSNLLQTIECPPDPTDFCRKTDCNYNQYSSNNFYSLYTYGGNHIYYSTVTEDLGNNFGNGYIEHHFQVAHDVTATSLLNTVVKGSPLSSYGIYNGFEYQTKYYKNTGAAFSLYRQIDKVQYSDPRLSADNNFYSFTTDPGFFQDCDNRYLASSLFQFFSLHVAQIDLLSRWLYTDSVKTTDYDDNGNILQSVVADTYGNPTHQEVTQSQTTNSKGENKTTYSFYPTDNIPLTDPDAIAAKTSLESAHMYSGLLKQQTFNGASILKEEQNYYTNNLLPIPVLNKHYEAYLGDTLQLKSEITRYGSGGTLLEAMRNRSGLVAYLWDYKQQFPIAQAANALNADIAYTSFEADRAGNWSVPDTARNYVYSMTGSLSYDLTAAKTITATVTGATGKPYVVSYWTRNGSVIVSSNEIPVPAGAAGLTKNGWTYYEHLLPATTTSVTVTASGNTTIDELRLRPENSQMTTYTYSPMIGMTSSCAANNTVLYYEYDMYARLMDIRDMDKNIVTLYNYQYKAQARYFNSVQSGNFTRNNCSADGTGGTVTYTVAAGTYSSAGSPADANLQAINDVNANGQQYANTNGSCTFYNAAASAVYTRNNCTGGAGSAVTYTVAAGVYSSTVNQAAADQLVQNDILANAQNYANANGVCPFLSAAQSGTFTRSNCSCGYYGSSVTYTVAQGAYTSFVSQPYADAKAQNVVNTNGPGYANANGTCTAIPCSGAGNRIVNCVCEAGQKVYTSSVYTPSQHLYLCTYHYLWSDGIISQNYTEYDKTSCAIQN